MATPARQPVLTVASINPNVVKAQYAVRGAIPLRSEELALKLKETNHSLPFKAITRCNIGNPQEIGQRPLTFVRQVCSLLDYDELLAPENEAVVSKLYPKDAVERARSLKTQVSSTGAYTHSMGIHSIRENVAAFLEQRDGFPANVDNLFLTDGASSGVKAILNTLIADPSCGVMIPIPQYPLYSASLALFAGKGVPYYLDEHTGWGFNVQGVRDALKAARDDSVDVRALVVINPGNPTGGCLSLAEMQGIVELCESERLVLLADEVYQSNVYAEGKQFHSFKRVVSQMNSPIELVSFHSVSKGFLGECGKRGGYMELVNFDPKVQQEIYKLASISLCPNVIGQVVVDVMVNPPKEGDESYARYASERDAILSSLKRRSETLVKAFNALEGVSCQPAEGAMYTFPSITLPDAAIKAAAQAKMAPDAFYCMQLVEQTGICVVPGSGFGQRPDTYHLRCTFLPPENTFGDFLKLLEQFHAKFMKEYGVKSVM